MHASSKFNNSVRCEKAHVSLPSCDQRAGRQVWRFRGSCVGVGCVHVGGCGHGGVQVCGVCRCVRCAGVALQYRSREGMFLVIVGWPPHTHRCVVLVTVHSLAV